MTNPLMCECDAIPLSLIFKTFDIESDDAFRKNSTIINLH